MAIAPGLYRFGRGPVIGIDLPLAYCGRGLRHRLLAAEDYGEVVLGRPRGRVTEVEPEIATRSGQEFQQALVGFDVDAQYGHGAVIAIEDAQPQVAVMLLRIGNRK